MGKHYGAFIGETLVSCLSYFAHANDIIRLHKFATATQWQQRGIGSRLLVGSAQELCQQDPAAQLTLNARVSACAFYERFGLTLVGDVFTQHDRAYQRTQGFVAQVAATNLAMSRHT